MRQHWLEGGRRVLWLSVSQDLADDAKRDLKDVGGALLSCSSRLCCLPLCNPIPASSRALPPPS